MPEHMSRARSRMDAPLSTTDPAATHSSGILKPLLIALTTALSSGSAVAQSIQTNWDPNTPDWISGKSGPLADWQAAKRALLAKGVDLSVGYTSETAGNPTGGNQQTVRETSQATITAKLDAEKLWGLTGGTFQTALNYRRGDNLSDDAGINTLQLIQEVFGRGQVARITQFFYEQSFGNGTSLKFGRATVGEDFASFSCDFMNLTFCGSQPGNVVGYWYNWPVSQWMARFQAGDADRYAKIGAYEINPRNIENGFTLGYLDGATGVMVPVEVGLTPRHAINGLPGTYKFGVWYDSSRADDVFLDANRGIQAVTNGQPLRVTGRYGAYFMMIQQLTGTADSRGIATSGLSVFLNATQADQRTSFVDSQIAIGMTYKAPFQGRPDDTVGLAVGRTGGNWRAVEGLAITAPLMARADAEYAVELYYDVRIAGWISLRPNVQYIMNPGGYHNRADVTVLGLKAVFTP